MPEPHRRWLRLMSLKEDLKPFPNYLKSINPLSTTNEAAIHTRNSTDVTQTSILFSVKHKYKKKIEAFLLKRAIPATRLIYMPFYRIQFMLFVE